MKVESIGKLRENIEKDQGWAEVELDAIEDKRDSGGDRVLFAGTHSKGAFAGEADREGKVIDLRLSPPAPNPAEKRERIKQILEQSGYKFEHPTLVLGGKDGWFVILTPGRAPHQAIVHWDGHQADFFATIPEQLLIE